MSIWKVPLFFSLIQVNFVAFFVYIFIFLFFHTVVFTFIHIFLIFLKDFELSFQLFSWILKKSFLNMATVSLKILMDNEIDMLESDNIAYRAKLFTWLKAHIQFKELFNRLGIPSCVVAFVYVFNKWLFTVFIYHNMY